MINRRQFIQAAAPLSVSAQQDQQARWIAIAESLKPRLKTIDRKPVAYVRPESAPGTCRRA